MAMIGDTMMSNPPMFGSLIESLGLDDPSMDFHPRIKAQLVNLIMTEGLNDRPEFQLLGELVADWCEEAFSTPDQFKAVEPLKIGKFVALLVLLGQATLTHLQEMAVNDAD